MENLFSPPDLFKAKRILAIQPHYDDNDIMAGGTLAKLSAHGAEILYLTVTDDLVGVLDQSHSDQEIVARLQAEQKRAGKSIGVSAHFWLDYPDAGRYDYFDLRRDLIQNIRRTRPDFILTCDPWSPYEAHTDHTLTGRAAAEAAILFGLPRLRTARQVDESFKPFELQGIAFYASAYPNTIVDISESQKRKHKAIECYRSQFSRKEMALLLEYLAYREQKIAENEKFTHGEALKILHTRTLHGFPDAYQL